MDLLIKIIKIFFENPMLFFVVLALIVFWCYDEFIVNLKSSPGHRKRKKGFINSKLKVTDKTKALGIIFGLVLFGKHNTKKALYSPYDDEGHIICVGGSGMGKTSALLIPTLNSWAKSGGTSFTIDISGDINKNVKMPHKIIYSPSKKNSIPYNIFGFIDRLQNEDEKDKALAKLALLIMPDDPEAGKGDAYYTKMGRKMLTASLIAFYYQNLDFVEICEKINSLTWRNLLNEIDASDDEKAISYINDFADSEERYNGNAKQSCADAISLFVTDEALKANIRRPHDGEKSFEPCLIEKNNCFICIPDDELEYYKPLTLILTSQCLDFFKTRSLDADHQILFCLDEAASLGAIDILPPLRKFRKRKVRLFVLTQSLSDLDLTWGIKQRKSMMPNFRYKIILESSEPEEQQYWADLIGKEISTRLSSTMGGSSETSTLSETKDYKLEPSELANLGNELILLYPGGYKRLGKNFYYK